MKQRLTLIFETQGPQSLNISNQSFSDENIFEKFIDSCFFHQVNFINCSFEEYEFLGVDFYICVFEGCTFNSTIIRKSKFTDCVFQNCQFLESQLTPRTEFFGTSFINSQFSSVDFSFAFLCECKFIEINLMKTKFTATSIVDPKIEKLTFNDLEFDKTAPMRIKITDSLYFPKEI
jgi:uncharacterized protein YjbI with pentapeptide repeats